MDVPNHVTVSNRISAYQSINSSPPVKGALDNAIARPMSSKSPRISFRRDRD